MNLVPNTLDSKRKISIKECISETPLLTPTNYVYKDNIIFLSRKIRKTIWKDEEGNCVSSPGDMFGVVHCPTCMKAVAFITTHGYKESKTERDIKNDRISCCSSVITFSEKNSLKSDKDLVGEKIRLEYTKDEYIKNYLSIFPEDDSEETILIPWKILCIKFYQCIRIKCRSRDHFIEKILRDTEEKSSFSSLISICLLLCLLFLTATVIGEISDLRRNDAVFMDNRLDMISDDGILPISEDQWEELNLMDMTKILQEMDSKNRVLEAKFQFNSVRNDSFFIVLFMLSAFSLASISCLICMYIKR